MPKVKVAVPHEKDPDEMMQQARKTVEKLVRDFEGDDLEVEWKDRSADFQFKSRGFKIAGAIAVEENQIGVEVDLPFAAMIFKGRVEKALQKSLTRAAAADAPGEVGGTAEA